MNALTLSADSKSAAFKSAALQNAEENAVNHSMCGYTVWVQWCDATELHGYYHCVGLRNDRFHFQSRRDPLAELFADSQGFWYLMFDGQCLYKSKGRGHDDPPPRSWRCIEGSLPPPGVSTVDLPEDATPMVVVDESKRRPLIPPISIPNELESASSITSTMTSTPATTRMHTVKSLGTPQTPSNAKTKKKRKKKVFPL